MNERRINRREFLKLACNTGAVIAFGSPILDTMFAHDASTPSLTRNFWEKVETGTLFENAENFRQRLETKYNVVILPADNPDDIAKRIGADVETIKKVVRLRVDWDGPRLKALEGALSILPEQFYTPAHYDNQNRPLTFSLYENVYGAKARALSIYNEIELGKSDLVQTWFNQLSSKKTIIHEITHTETGHGFSDKAERLKQVAGIRNISELRRTFASVISEYKDPHLEYLEELKLASWTDHIGYGASNFDEFWSVSAEYYIEGRESFIKKYSPFLGPDKAVLFYDGLRDQLFYQVEYSKGNRVK